MGDGLEPGTGRAPRAVDFPDDESMRISHEAIYQALFVQKGGALRVSAARTRSRGKHFFPPRS